MANQVRIGVGTQGASKAASDLDKLRDKFDKLQKTSGKGLVIGAGAGLGLAGVNALTGGVRMATDAIFDSIDAASHQREALSLNSQVFKTSADTIDDWSDGTARAFGESKTSAINFAAGFGNVMKSAGLSIDTLAEKSMELTRRAADIGSAFDASGEEVATAIKSGLVGESEPLRRFGVLLSEAKVKAKGMEMGLADAHGELTDGEKVLARYQIIMDESAESAGMFGRDLGSSADNAKRLSAEMEDLGAELGTRVQPAIVDLQKTLLGVFDNLDALSGKMGEVEKHKTLDEILFAGTPLSTKGIEEFLDFITPWDGVFNQAEDTVDHFAGKTADDLDTASRSAAASLGDMGEAAEDFRDKYKDVTGDVIRRNNRMVDNFVDTTQDIIDGAFDPLETRADLHDTRMQIHADQEKLRNSKSKEDHRQTADDIVSSLHDEADALNKLGKKHELTGKDVDRFTDDAKAFYKSLGKKVPADIQRIIDRLRQLANIPDNTKNVVINTRTTTGRAGNPGKVGTPEGDPGTRNASGKVGLTNGTMGSPDGGVMGEAGTEAYAILRNPKPIPSGGFGGGGNTFNVTVNAGAGSGLTAGGARQVAQELAPAIYAEFARQNVPGFRRGSGLTG